MPRAERLERIEELDHYRAERSSDFTEDYWSGEDYAIELMYLRHLEEEGASND